MILIHLLRLLHTFDKLERCLPVNHINTTRLVCVGDTIASIRHVYHLGPESCADELTASILVLATLTAQPLQHLGNCSTILRVEIGIDFVKEVERRGIALLDSKDEGKRTERLLTSRELPNLLLLVVLAVERYGNADTCVLFHFALLALGLFLFHVIVVRYVATRVAVRFAVDNEATAADGNELLEDFAKSCGDLLEGTGDGLVFALVEHIDKVLDGLARCVEFGTTFCERSSLTRKVLVMFECFLVDVGEALQCLVGLGEFFGDLVGMSAVSRFEEAHVKLTFVVSHRVYFRLTSSGRVPRSRISRLTSANRSV
jgi:hypothetical protein